MAQLYAYDAIIFAVSKNSKTLEALKAEFPNIEIRAVDMEDWNATRAVIETIGHVHFLVNNAGVAESADFLTTTPENYDK